MKIDMIKIVSQFRVMLAVVFYLSLMLFPLLFARNIYSTFEKERNYYIGTHSYTADMTELEQDQNEDGFTFGGYILKNMKIEFICQEVAMKAFAAFLLSGLWTCRRMLKLGAI